MGWVLTILQSKTFTLNTENSSSAPNAGLQPPQPTKRERPVAQENDYQHDEAFKKNFFLPKH